MPVIYLFAFFLFLKYYYYSTIQTLAFFHISFYLVGLRSSFPTDIFNSSHKAQTRFHLIFNYISSAGFRFQWYTIHNDKIILWQCTLTTLQISLKTWSYSNSHSREKWKKKKPISSHFIFIFMHLRSMCSQSVFMCLY